jgi:hypothetical protein
MMETKVFESKGKDYLIELILFFFFFGGRSLLLINSLRSGFFVHVGSHYVCG